jgi:hypothetical protein
MCGFRKLKVNRPANTVEKKTQVTFMAVVNYKKLFESE